MKNYRIWLIARQLSRYFYYLLYILDIKIYSLKGIEVIIVSPGKSGSSTLSRTLRSHGLSNYQLHVLSKDSLEKSIKRDVDLYRGITAHLYKSWCIHESMMQWQGRVLIPLRPLLVRDLSSLYQNLDVGSYKEVVSPISSLENSLRERYLRNTEWYFDMEEWFTRELGVFNLDIGSLPQKNELSEFETSNHKICIFDIRLLKEVLDRVLITREAVIMRDNISSNKFYSKEYQKARKVLKEIEQEIREKYCNEKLAKWL